MSWYLLEPRDPLLVRDGRPFGLETEGARSLDFPPPSVVAGTIRGRIGYAVGTRDRPFGLTPAEAREIVVHGPLLCELSGDQLKETWLPAPRDCALFGQAPIWERYALAPHGHWSDGASSLGEVGWPVEPVVPLPKTKPPKPLPAYWSAGALREWLARPAQRDQLPVAHTRPALLHETRAHVAIDPSTGTAEDHKLFQTDGLRFQAPWSGPARPGEPPWQRLALLARCADRRLHPGLVTLGGERRLTRLARLNGAEPTWSPPSLPNRRARVMLLTPALFEEGAVPVALAGATVRAAAVGRPLTLSGWDLAEGGPKPSRRAAPAGSVYWVELPEGIEPTAWVQRVHFQCLSTQAQDRQDGFGLCAVGVWT